MNIGTLVLVIYPNLPKPYEPAFWKISTDGGLLLFREQDEVLGLHAIASGRAHAVTGRDLMAEQKGASKTIEEGREKLAAAGIVFVV